MMPMGLVAMALIPLAATIAALADAEPPALLNYQGVLRDPNNAPITGAFDMYFRFYDAPTGGNQILRDLHRSPGPQVSVTGGLFSVQLGSGTVLDGGSGLPNGPYTSLAQVFRDFAAVFMEVQIAGETLSPRIRIVAAAYALNADHLDGKDASEYLDVSATPQMKAGDLAVGGNVSVTGAVQLQSGGPDAGKVLTSTDLAGNAAWQDPQPGPEGPPGPQGSQGPPGVTGRPVHSITVVDDVGDTGLYPSIIIGADGLPIISYYDATAGDLKVAHCLDAGCTTSGISAPLGAPQDEGQHSSIAIGADGLAIISYVAGAQIRAAHCSDTACTSATPATVATLGGPFTSTSIAIGVDGFPIIGHGGASDIWVSHCEDSQCGGVTGTLLDTPGGEFVSLVIDTIDPNNPLFGIVSASAIISYEETTNGVLRLGFCADLACTTNSVGEPWQPPYAPGRGRNSSLSIGVDGVPVFSTGPDTLYFIRCADSICSGVDVGRPLDGPDVQFTSITIGTDGLPVIAYAHVPDTGSGEPYLKVVHCESPDCSGFQTFELDSVPDALPPGESLQVSMTIGTDGFPVIAYTFPGTSGRDLKVAHCSNRSCIPWYRRR